MTNRTVGCTSLSSTVPWKATVASQWPQWSLLPETEECVCVLKKQVCWDNTALLYLIGKKQGMNDRNGRVLPKFRGVFNFFPHYKFLIFFQRLQCFLAWKQKLICERWSKVGLESLTHQWQKNCFKKNCFKGNSARYLLFFWLFIMLVQENSYPALKHA